MSVVSLETSNNKEKYSFVFFHFCVHNAIGITSTTSGTTRYYQTDTIRGFTRH